ncbi:unnamed protein product [Pleuronectes platessa]|uniref:Uncharacterized protein n=1 Tax=Pleuronectes platessa TaxID=8262 RepID=A0A9N7TJU6_PLEPL|nr:unnamed protein product [Pleuronectes platessa]
MTLPRSEEVTARAAHALLSLRRAERRRAPPPKVAQEHVVTQRPMPSPEQAISTVRAAAAAVGLALERNSAFPLQRETPLEERERERGREREGEGERGRGGGGLLTEQRMRMQREGDVAEEADQMLSTAQQMLQDSRSKIELIRLQIIRVTQAGSSSSGSSSSSGRKWR